MARQPLVERVVAGALARLGPARRKQVVDQVLRPALRLAFHAGQRAGLHILPNYFYSPVPDTRTLPDELWTRQGELPGVDLREQAQVALLTELAAAYSEEFNALPRHPGPAPGFYLHNPRFGAVDAEIAYALVRQAKPRQVVEVGSGFSTLLLLEALRANERDGHPGRLTACEPYPDGLVRAAAAADPRLELRPVPVQAVPLEVFTGLGRGDVLFIDSTHVCKIGSDVQYEILEVLPRLRPGVLVHLHDIFLPQEYPKDWVLRLHRFWNEQYLLQAFLAFNHGYEVVWGSSLMHLRHPDLLREAIASYDPDSQHPGSFWLRRVGA